MSADAANRCRDPRHPRDMQAIGARCPGCGAQTCYCDSAFHPRGC